MPGVYKVARMKLLVDSEFDAPEFPTGTEAWDTNEKKKKTTCRETKLT